MKSISTARVLCILAACGVAGAAWAQDGADPVQAPAGPAGAAAPAAPVLSAEAGAFRSELGDALAALPPAERAAIESFFAARDFAPFWTEAGADRATVLIAAIENSGAQGLVPGQYAPAALEMNYDDAEPAPQAAREVAAMRAYLRFGGDLGAGLLVPGDLDPEISVAPARAAPAALVARLETGPLDAVLRGLEPASPDYRRLVAEKLRLERVARSGAWGPPVPAGPTLHQGETDPRIGDLRARMARLGYGAPTGEQASATFDEPLLQAVKAFQRDHGLVDDGAVGSRTLAAVNATAEDRVAQVLVNLERLRWSDRDPATRHLVVNIPDYVVTLHEDGAPAWRTRAVVGEARETRTPEFSDVVSYLVVNPTWHIPDSIAKRVYLPKLNQDPNVLADSNMRLFTRAGTEINPRLVDFTQYTSSNFPFRIKQNPSAANALGRVKFMFPNQFSIYLHDTPARELFAKDARAFSNGCIRLEDPLELAFILLAGQEADPVAAFDRWLAAKSERHVTLARPIPVDLVYRTVTFAEDGTPRYLDDVYGRDATVFRALEAAGVTLAAAQG